MLLLKKVISIFLLKTVKMHIKKKKTNNNSLPSNQISNDSNSEMKVR